MARRKNKILRDKPSEVVVSISKKEVARREVNSAVRVLFLHEDTISAQVLAAAAVEILTVLGSRKGVDTIQKEILSQVKEEYRDDFLEILKEPYNFFKHGARDGDVAYDMYRDELAEFEIWQAVEDYQIVFSELSLEMMVFRAWFYARYPDFLTENARRLIPSMQEATGTPEGKPLREAISKVRRFLMLYDELSPQERRKHFPMFS